MNEIQLPALDDASGNIRPNVLAHSVLLYEKQSSGLYLPNWLHGSSGAAHVDASPGKTIAVTPSDATVYDPPLIGFRVGSTVGDVAVIDLYGNTVVIPNVQIGEKIAGGFTKIKATSTTATGITGWSR